MSDIAIKVENLSKLYHIGSKKTGSLTESFTNIFKNKDYSTSEFWALKDVSFEVKKGEAVGIIGRNGAGKSTLLKILSRITVPTRGSFEISGRVSSLLEVGTGFHPELSGRENIYLNGTILGMKRKEIKAKLDEIIAFSGVEKFMDTPVKHYSSGMKVRLAFSVAAHLEPEILIIDEVLAVGDSIFQSKCIEKMTEVAKSGRTILFVSHNMQAVKNLCKSALLISEGEILALGTVENIIGSYLHGNISSSNRIYNLSEVKRNGRYVEGLMFNKLEFDKSSYLPGESICFSLLLKKDNQNYKDLLFGVNLTDSHGTNILHLSNIFINKIKVNHLDSQIYKFIIPSLSIKPGKYYLSLFLKANEEIQDWIKEVALLIIEDGNIYNFNNSQMIKGLIQPQFSFIIEDIKFNEEYY